MDKYLNEDAITAEIMSYVKNRIYNYAVLIDGDWGTGKTYFIQKSIIPTLEGSGYMPIYISLYGVNSTDTVSQKIALSILTNMLNVPILKGRLPLPDIFLALSSLRTTYLSPPSTVKMSYPPLIRMFKTKLLSQEKKVMIPFRKQLNFG